MASNVNGVMYSLYPFASAQRSPIGELKAKRTSHYRSSRTFRLNENLLADRVGLDPSTVGLLIVYLRHAPGRDLGHNLLDVHV